MKVLVLAGSGEFTDALLNIDRHIISTYFNRVKKSITIIPLAAGQEVDYYKWIEMGLSHFKQLEVEVTPLDVTNRDQLSNKNVLEQINYSNMVYFSGGHPGFLNDALSKTKFWQILKSKYNLGKLVLAGSSAGAMVMGNYVLGNAQEIFTQNQEPKWDQALNLIPYAIIPHFNEISQMDSKKFESLMNNLPRKISQKLIGIDEDTVMIVEDSVEVKVMGKGSVYLFKGRKELIYNQGDKFKL